MLRIYIDTNTGSLFIILRLVQVQYIPTRFTETFANWYDNLQKLFSYLFWNMNNRYSDDVRVMGWVNDFIWLIAPVLVNMVYVIMILESIRLPTYSHA